MYIYQKKTKIGRVTIEQHGGGYRLRFTYPKKHRHEIKISNVTDESYLIALKRARQISSDIDNDCFDFDYIKYKPELAKTINVISKKAVEVKPEPKPKPKIIKINDVWDRYKESNKLITEKTTQISTWKQTDNCLAKVSEKSLEINNTDLLVSELLAIYSVGTLAGLKQKLSPNKA